MIHATNSLLWGFVPQMLNEADPMPLWEQIHNSYAHGGGWVDMPQFELIKGGANTEFVIQYPCDPKMYELGRIVRGDEYLALFDYSFMLWFNAATGEKKIARID